MKKLLTTIIIIIFGTCLFLFIYSPSVKIEAVEYPLSFDLIDIGYKREWIRYEINDTGISPFVESTDKYTLIGLEIKF